MTLSVFIPTCNRPTMLRTALFSVANQTAIDQVSEVIVIENGLCRESKAICDEFPNLPINYLFRETPLSPGIESIDDAMKYIHGDFLAILFDDDWWLESHLERAMGSFTMWDNVIASYANCITTSGEQSPFSGFFCQFNPWFAATEKQKLDRWQFSLADLLVANLISTAFHFSSLVVTREVWMHSIEVIRDGNPYDIDRLLAVEFGKFGSVIADHIPSVVVRMHPGQEAIRLIGDEGQKWWDCTTKKLTKLASERGIDIKQEFMKRLRMKEISTEKLIEATSRNSKDTLEEYGVIDAGYLRRHSRLSSTKKILRELCPPFVYKLLSKLVK